MTPDLGQGACQALTDGVVLGQCLATMSDTAADSPDDVTAALRRYDSLRRKPSQRIAGAARGIGQLTMRPRTAFARNALLRLGGVLMH
jgi:2-polyprenyl-6-methoxyphenol hydroxylase-like FAD-dependent oxidoreductase